MSVLDRIEEPVGTGELERRVRVVAKERCAEGVVSVVVAASDGGTLASWEPGAHVDLVASGVGARQYSLCGDPRDASAYRLGVLREVDGRGCSIFVHDELAVGDEVVLRGPRNHFRLEAATSYLFIAGGIGITAILPMVVEAERRGVDWRLAYGGRRRASMAFLDELAVFGDRVLVHPEDQAGLLDLDGLIGEPKEGALVYCCGPEPLLAAVEERCRPWPPGALQVERFRPREPEEATSDTAFEVVLARSSLTLTVPAGASILETVRAAGVNVVSSCQEGVCGTCETDLLEGEADHRDSVLDDLERCENTCMMLCVSRALSARLVLDL